MASDQQRQDDLLIVSGVFASISFIAVALRVWVRGCLIKKMGMDDWTMLGALVFSLAYFAELIVGKYNGIGFPMETLSLDNMIRVLQATLSIQVTYYVIIFFVKVSILFMYLRFAVTRTLRVLSIGTIGLHAVFFVICLAGTLGQCRPLKKMWDMEGVVEGGCINTTAFFYFTSGFNILTDIWIICLPIKTLYYINRPTREKYALLAIFGIGIFACVISIVRLHSIYTYTLATDPFKNALKVNLWSMVEVNVAIVCASVPALKPLFTPAKLRKAVGQGRSGYQYQSSEKSNKSVETNGSNPNNSRHAYGIDNESIPDVPVQGIHVQRSVIVESKEEASSTDNILIERPSQ